MRTSAHWHGACWSSLVHGWLSVTVCPERARTVRMKSDPIASGYRGEFLRRLSAIELECAGWLVYVPRLWRAGDDGTRVLVSFFGPRKAARMQVAERDEQEWLM